MSVAAAQAAARARLAHLSDHATLDGTRLLEAVTGRNRAWLLAHGDAALSPAQRKTWEALLARRAGGEPLAYVLGAAGFYGRSFEVTPDVLVPRPESEQLVELALAFARRAASPARPRIADVGTGSGILAISLALALPAARLWALDVSSAALAVALRNARAHAADERITFALGDVLEGLDPSLHFDLVLANLPYVRSPDLAAAPDPTSFEPRLALDGGPDGLALYRRLLARAPQHAAPGGALFLEAGPDTAGALAELAASVFGPRARVALARDYAGRERVVTVEIA
jgi:release factor glutamine methyltransferase